MSQPAGPSAPPPGPPPAVPARFARRHALGLLGAGGMAVLNACAGKARRVAVTDGSGAPTVPTTSGPPTVPTVPPTTTPSTSTPPATTTTIGARYDASKPLWTQGNFAPVNREVEAFDLPVVGVLPPDLDGLYVRNGPNPFGGGGRWQLGDGMVHGMRLGAGGVAWYRNRFVHTDVLGGGGPTGTIPNTSNTSVRVLGHRLLSLQETGGPYELDPASLDTIGAWNASGRLGSLTAHPKTDPATGRTHAFATSLTAPYLTYLVFEPNGTIAQREPIALRAPSMMHDFAITDRDVVFFDLPAIYSIEDAVNRPGTLPYRWQPDAGARVGVMPLGGTAKELAWVDIEPCYVFHATNAWREGSDIVLDVSHLPSVFSDGPTDGPMHARDLRRWRIGTGSAALTWRQDVLSPRPFDLPTIRPDSVGRPHAVAFYATTRSVPGGWEYAGIAGFEPRSAAVDAWDAPAELSAGEPLVVGGFVLTFVYDRARAASSLYVFDATRVTNGPIATVALPQRVPYGQHGTWLPGGVA